MPKKVVFLIVVLLAVLDKYELVAGGNDISIELVSGKIISHAELILARDGSLVISTYPNATEEHWLKKQVAILEIGKDSIKSLVVAGEGDGHAGTGALIGLATGGILGALVASSTPATESNTGSHPYPGGLKFLGVAIFSALGTAVGAGIGSFVKDDLVLDPASVQSFESLKEYARYREEPEFLRQLLLDKNTN